MARKTFDPATVANALARGSAEAREAPLSRASQPVRAQKVTLKKLEKTYLSVLITPELHDAVYEYAALEYRKIAHKSGLHPGVGGAVENLLRKALEMKPL